MTVNGQMIHASIHHAVKFKICTESLAFVPKSVVVDGIVSYGGSTGVGVTLAKKAYGEFFERNHLFTAVPIHSKKKLNDIQPIAWRNKLLSLCQLDTRDDDVCLNHSFLFTQVTNIFDHANYDYFYNAISLNGNKFDAAYLGFSDSCGCASHPIKSKALYNSLMEFLERQALLGSWLSRRCEYAIHPFILHYVTPYKKLVETLLENGELFIFKIGEGLPAYTIIMFYFSKSTTDIVQYSIGASCGLSLPEALTSALEELYQCYAFLYNVESSKGLENKAGSGYHLKFQQCNRQETKLTIPFLHEEVPLQITSIEEVQNLKKFSEFDVLRELQAITKHIYYYHYFEPALNLHITKIMSPDFFAHMSLDKPLNFDNVYARKLHINKQDAYLEQIPFP